MTDFSDALNITSTGLRAQASRIRHLSENIANADTPGFRRKTVSFEQVVEAGRPNGQVATGPVRLDQAELTQIFDPSHPLANENGYYEGSNVNLLVEIADAREAQRSYEANLKLFEQVRQMSSALNELMRR